MSSKSITTAEKHEASPGELNQRVEQLRKKIDSRNESLAAAQKSQSQLATERETLVLPARVEGDAGAQKRLREIDTQLVGVRRDISDDTAAVAELGAQLAAAEQAVELAEWESRRVAVRELLNGLLKRRQRANLEKAAEGLLTALTAAAEEDKEAFSALISFEPALRGAAIELLHLSRLRAQILAAKLFKVLPIDLSGYELGRLRDQEMRDYKYYEAAVEALDQMELVF
jgi:hypothetical protein